MTNNQDSEEQSTKPQHARKKILFIDSTHPILKEELKNVKGIGEKKFEKIKDLISV